MNDVFKVYKNNNGVKLESTTIFLSKDSYLVEMNNTIIGYFNVNYFGENISFDYELLKDYRHIGLGNIFFKVIENWIFENFSFKKIILFIRYDNDISKNIICKNNYLLDYEESEKISIDGEMTMYTPFAKQKSKVKKLV